MSNEDKTNRPDRREFLVKVGKVSAGVPALSMYLSAGVLAPSLAQAQESPLPPPPVSPSPMSPIPMSPIPMSPMPMAPIPLPPPPPTSDVPEPTTMAIVGGGVAGMALLKKGVRDKIGSAFKNVKSWIDE